MYRERKGVLLIADISGYTEYLESKDLAHVQGIISELLETLIDASGNAFEVAKLEGDAVFFLAEDQRLVRAGPPRVLWRAHGAWPPRGHRSGGHP